MSTHFIGEGNLGGDPDLREFANGNDQPNTVLKLNVYCDNPVRDRKTNEWADNGGFWIQVDYWNRQGPELEYLLQKGMRVRVEGTLRMETWTNSDQQEVSGIKCDAHSITICPHRIEAISLKAREASPSQPAPAPAQSAAMKAEGKPAKGGKSGRGKAAQAPQPPSGHDAFDDDVPY